MHKQGHTGTPFGLGSVFTQEGGDMCMSAVLSFFTFSISDANYSVEPGRKYISKDHFFLIHVIISTVLVLNFSYHI